MKSYKRILWTVLSAAFVFSSCTKKSEIGKMVPKDAMFVLHLDTKSLLSKVTWQDVKQNQWYQKVTTDPSLKAWQKKLVADPESSGIDMNGGLIFFAEKDANNPDGILAVEGSIKDAAAFTQFNKDLDSTSTIKTDGGISLLTLHGEAVVGWDGNHFAYVFSAAGAKSKLESLNPMGGQGSMTPLVPQTQSLSTACQNLFSLKSDQNLTKNEKFSNLLGETGDIHVWINSEEIMKNSSGLGMLGMLKLDVFFKDNISTYTVNFDQGKIDITHKGYAGKELMDFMKKYQGGSINSDMISAIPSTNIDGIFAMHFQPQGLKELIQMIGLDGVINNYSGKIGFGLDDFVKANSGDLVVALSDLSVKKSANDQSVSDKPSMNVLFSVGIGDKASFQKLLDAGKQLGGAMGPSDTSVVFGQNDKYFAISNHQHFLNDFVAGNAHNHFPFMDQIGGHSMGLYIDLHRILTEIKNNAPLDPDQDTLMNASLGLWKDIYGTSGDITGGAIVGHTQIDFMDGSTNSLVQLNHYFDKMSSIAIRKMEEEKKHPGAADSVMLVPPMDTVGHK